MKTSHYNLLAVLVAILLPLPGFAQVNSGSNGSDGALNPTSDLVIDMADHPDGIYHYTSVNIPSGVTVSFIPNAANKPVVWLVQGDCVVSGWIDIAGKGSTSGVGSLGGPGGGAGGNGGSSPTSGGGPGGGGKAPGGTDNALVAGSASFGTLGTNFDFGIGGAAGSAGQVYGNAFLVPLVGGSGGGGSFDIYYNGYLRTFAGGGGAGALLIAASGHIEVNGGVNAQGGAGAQLYPYLRNMSGAGSGGAIRFVTSSFRGSGTIVTDGGIHSSGSSYGDGRGGAGRVRIDAFQNSFGGYISGVLTQGFQPIIFPAPGQGIQLSIQSLAGVAVVANPSGVLANPDVIIPAQQANPIPVVVHCTNIPLNTEISVVVHPANGPDVQAVGLNNVGTQASSTATVSLNMPRGGGIIYAKAVTGIAGTASTESGDKSRSLAETGWSATGERFKAIEITAALGGQQRIAYITESGKRYEAN